MIDDGLDYRFTICGVPGMGKTYYAKRLFRQHRGPAIFLDTVGVCRDLAGCKRYRFTSAREAYDFRPVIAQLKAGRKVVFHMERIMREELTAFANALAVELSLHQWKGLMLLVDEAKEYMPQSMQRYAYELERLIRLGRNQGITRVGLITQRFASVHKEVVALSGTFVIFQNTYPNDLRVIEEIFSLEGDGWAAVKQRVKTLGLGEYIVFRNGKWTYHGRDEHGDAEDRPEGDDAARDAEGPAAHAAEGEGPAAQGKDAPGPPGDGPQTPGHGRGPDTREGAGPDS